MEPRLLVGPPGSGKTERMVAVARRAALEGRRVWWIGLPAQRAHVLRRVTREGPLLGFEFLTPQQLAYRLLADARRLRPLLTGTGRLALVGEALRGDRRDPPSPGEARLFARAIAEAKRHGLPAGRIPGEDPETARLRRVFAAYEAAKGEAWDYDDFRLAAAAYLEEGPGGAPLEPELAIVDGFRELGPLDLRLARGLARHVPVRLALAIAPPGVEPDEALPPRDDATLRAYRFPNPVAEARWVLRDVKAQLARGADPLDLALVVPPGRARAVATLAEEFGVPLMDETPRGLADRPEGRRLLDLLDLPDAPTASRLLGVPELRGLGAAVLEAGVAGREAIGHLAAARGEGAAWRAWLARLEPPAGDPMAWGERLVDAALAAEAPDAERARFRDHALQRLAEARRVASGPHVRGWWAALLQETTTFARPDAGVALLHPDAASGRRFRRVWLVGAAEGAYGTAEREDYFVPEELRLPLEAAFARAGLPRRFAGRREAEFDELRVRGDVTIATVAEGDRGGRLVPEAALVGDAPEPPPELPAGSPLERAAGAPYRPPDGPVALGAPDVERLGRFARCGFRWWAEARLYDAEDAPDWIALRRELRAAGRVDAVRRAALGAAFPWAAAWLERHADTLAGFAFGVELGEPDGPRVRLDAARRADGEATLVRFAAPGSVASEADAERVLDARAAEYWAAAHLFERHPRQVRRVAFWVWPLGGEPVAFPERPLAKPWGRFARVRRDVEAALPAWRAGRVAPRPGWACRDCTVFDLCREGRR